jgi:hypothetical protein
MRPAQSLPHTILLILAPKALLSCRMTNRPGPVFLMRTTARNTLYLLAHPTRQDLDARLAHAPSLISLDNTLSVSQPKRAIRINLADRRCTQSL